MSTKRLTAFLLSVRARNFCPCKKYLVLATGPFNSLSNDFKTFVAFISRERAMQTMALENINPALAHAVHQRREVYNA